jgi:OmpA-OmpF porin, OOP family
MKFKAALIAASTLLAGTAIADDNGFYAGAGAGWSNISIPESKVTSSIADAFAFEGAPLTTWSSKTDDSAIMWSAFVGYRFMKYLAVEAGYLDTGSATYTGSGTTDLIIPPATVAQSVPVKATLDWQGTGWPVSVLGIWPINDNWDVFGRVGGFFGDVKSDARLTAVDTTTGATSTGKGHTSGSSTEFIYGVGVDGRFLESWAARFEWLAIPSLGDSDTGEADWNAFQFALLYRF